MAAVNWTPQQKNAIEARGGSLLVSAAAGSGKTAVLSERVIHRMLDSQTPTDIDRMLIVTFTRAAVEQMRDKISSKLQRLLEQRPGDPALKRQLLLLGKAQISTIDSFCLRIVRQNFQKLGLSPDFVVGDENDLGNLREAALKDCAERFYSESEEFAELAELINSGRDDRNLFHTVFRLFDFVRSHPFYEDWLAEKLAMYDASVSVCDTVWGKVILDYAADALAYCDAILTEALELIAQSEKMTTAYLGAYTLERARVRELRAVLHADSHASGDWDSLCEQLAGAQKPYKLDGAVRGEENEGAKKRVTDIRKEVSKIITKLSTRLFASTSGEFTEDIADLRPKISLLFDLTLAFAKSYDALKRERRMVDYPDLVQFALELLYDTATSDEHGAPAKTPLARELAQGFDEIMIDEYQDTNEAQNMIFAAIARCDSAGTPQNLFLVGDVKQSIYRFRQAMPELFMQKKKTYAPYDGTSYPAKINLGANFRSRAGVTDFINFVFTQLMSEQLGEMDYGVEEALLPRANYPATAELGAELVVIDNSADESEDDKIVLEARYVARRIAEMLTEGYRVVEDGESRRATQSDFCVLLRSKQGKLDAFVKELQANGVNAWAEAQGGYLAAREISLMLSLLRVIDNPLLDVPLTAVMLSDLFAFTPDELATVRLRDRRRALYLNLCGAADEGDAKCAELVRSISKYGAHAVTEPVDELLLRIYRETDYPAMVSVMPMGETRKANLRLLAEYAAGYDKAGHKGLCGFVRFVDRVMERGSDFSPASTLSESADVVRVMTIHHSKGLEFPVVFLCDAAKQHNNTDYTRERTMLHAKLGFACRRRDFALMKEFTTVPMEALKLESERSSLSEELRVLYVAMTRAKEKLIVTMVEKKLESTLKSLAAGLSDEPRVSGYLVRGCKSFADWLLLCALRHPDGVNLRGRAALDDDMVLDEASRLQISITQPLTASGAQLSDEILLTEQPVAAILAEISSHTAFVYPHAAATTVPTKLGVSSIAHGAAKESHRFARAPKFLTKKELTGAQKGSALHQFMQFADYAAAAKNATAELDRMLALGFLTRTQRESIDVKKIKAFFTSGLYRRIAAAADVRRELRFLAQLPAGEVGFGGTDKADSITVQGVADCVFVENGSAVIVDYKTDAVNNPQQLAERYLPQLALYKKMLEESLRLPVRECVLYSFALGTEIPLFIPSSN